MINVVNIIPKAMSGETNQDSEPNIAINPVDPKQIVISAFTPDPNGGPNAPVYVSVDGGDTWELKTILPGDSFVGTYDITLKYGKTSGELYAGILNGNDISLNVLRSGDPSSGTLMTLLDSGTSIDQPFVATGSPTSGPDKGDDRLYVGYNNLADAIGKSSVIDQTMAAQTATPVFKKTSLESRDKNVANFSNGHPQNGPQVRTAVTKDGIVYSTFYSWKSFAFTGSVTADVVVVRDDNWGNDANAYTALTDVGDNKSGVRVATGITFPFISGSPSLGQERIGGDLAIASNPLDSSIVYICWADSQGSVYTLHLSRSTDSGQTWSADILTIPNGKNPGLAINTYGLVGFLYQQVTETRAGQRWETHLLFSLDGINYQDNVMATVPADTPKFTFLPYIGDYANLISEGASFYGVFCTNNTPDLANFPQKVKYQRNHDFTKKTLYNVDGVTPVAPSIDPFYFQTDSPLFLPTLPNYGLVIFILFGIIAGGGGAYIDPSGHIHIVGPGDPGPVWEYLVNLANYRVAENSKTKGGLAMQKLALENVIKLANKQIDDLNEKLNAE